MDKIQCIDLDEAKDFAKLYTNSIKMAALTINRVLSPAGDGQLDIKTLYDEVGSQIQDALHDVNFGHEVMLCAQAKTLEVLFNKMLSRAVKAEYMNEMQAYADLALRVQNHCRKTLLAINALRCLPQQHTIVKQQNVAINQQVNNDVISGNVKIKSENELISEKTNETLDIGGAFQAVPANQGSSTVEAFNRAKNAKRKACIKP